MTAELIWLSDYQEPEAVLAARRCRLQGELADLCLLQSRRFGPFGLRRWLWLFRAWRVLRWA